MSEMDFPTEYCPYLATREDPETRYGYATLANVCYRPPSEIYAVPPEEQMGLCLTRAHSSCPLYLDEGLLEKLERGVPGGVLPLAGRSAGRPKSVWLIPALIVVALALVLLVALVRPPLEERDAMNGQPATKEVASTSAQDGERRRKVAAVTPTSTETPVRAAARATTAAKDRNDTPAPIVEVVSGGKKSVPGTDSRPTATVMPTSSPVVPQVVIRPTATAAPPSPTPAPVDLTDIHHLLQPYQSVDQLARFYRVSVQQILAQNDLQSVEEVRSGQEIQIPVPPDRAPAVPSVAATAVSRHVVQEGEYMHLLADRYGTTVEEILRLNPWGNGIGLYPGRVLFIPVEP